MKATAREEASIILEEDNRTAIQRDPVLAQRKGETDLAYHKRLIYGKLIDKTLADYDYTELSEYVYGKRYSPDVARRLMYGSKRTLELMEDEVVSAISEESILSEIDEKMLELRKEQQRFFDQRRELNKRVAADGRREHLYDYLTEAANKLNETIGSVFGNDTYDGCRYEDTEAVLVLSDWHYGLVADNIYNNYNTNICTERVRSVVNSTIDRLILHKCRTLHVVLLGDMFHGAIHTSARVASEELVCDQIMQVSEILAQAIDTLSRFVDSVSVYSTYGNHGRTVQDKKENIHKDNMERLIPWWLKQRLAKNDKVTIIGAGFHEFIYFKAAGHAFCASHGDLDSVKSSPRLLATLFQKQFGADIEYILLGDKHHRESFEELGVTAMLCGSLCGADDYANGKRLFSTPSQLLLIVHPDIGIDAEYRIGFNSQGGVKYGSLD